MIDITFNKDTHPYIQLVQQSDLRTFSNRDLLDIYQSASFKMIDELDDRDWKICYQSLRSELERRLENRSE